MKNLQFLTILMEIFVKFLKSNFSRKFGQKFRNKLVLYIDRGFRGWPPPSPKLAHLLNTENFAGIIREFILEKANFNNN